MMAGVMSPLIAFLEGAKRRIERRRALVWVIRGTAIGTVGILLILIATRRSVVEGAIVGWVAASAVLGGGVAVVGWLAARPALTQVARIADRSLEGRARLATALELAESQGAEEHLLVARQRADTEAWIGTADPARVARPRLPRPSLALGAAAALLSFLLVVLPNRAQAPFQAAEQAEAVRDLAAERIAAEVDQAAQPLPGEDADRRQALVGELRRIEAALREAKSTEGAVAELSRGEASLRSLANPSSVGRRSAAAGAGAALTQAAPAAAAGAALAEAGSPATDELRQLAEALPGLSPGDQAALSKDLNEAAGGATDPVAAQALRQAAQQLASGQTTAAQQSLAAAARRQEEQRAEEAATKLSDLARALPALDTEQRAAVARALQEASAAADADPRLSETLAQASQGLQRGRVVEATAALDASGRRAPQLGPESALDGDAASAINEIKAVKESLLASQGEGAGAGQGQRPSVGQGQPQSPGDGITGSGTGQGKGDGDGSGRGQGPSSGGRPGEGKGSGQGQAAGSGSHRDGGANTGGAAGALEGPPGRPSEQVYVPGLPGRGRTQALPGEGGGSGTDSSLVPYESVYGEYRAEALSQANRQLIPERVQELLRQYFQESPP